MQNLANPQRFETFARSVTPFVSAAAMAAISLGLYFALFNSPPDYQQGDSVRIMYVHVPAAWLSLLIYTVMAGASALGFIFRHPLADVAAKSSAPIGAAFTFLALATGALWGKPMWGAWWAWDARLTSVLILLFLYLGYIALWNAIDDRARAARIAAITCIIGFINVPIIKFSVDWWASLHQPASVLRAGGPAIHESMLAPLFLMGLGYGLIFAALLLVSMRAELAERRIERLQQMTQRPSRATIS